MRPHAAFRKGNLYLCIRDELLFSLLMSNSLICLPAGIREKEYLSTLQEWEQILLPALSDVKRLISQMVLSHRIHLFARCILLVAITFGFAFRETSGITLLLERWQKEPLHCQWNYNDQGSPQIAVVEVATTHPTRQAVANTLSTPDLVPGYHIQLETPEPSRVRDAAHAQAIAWQVGRICQDLYDRRSVCPHTPVRGDPC